jgi:hypothetical protein
MAAMNRRELLTAAGVAATAPVLPGAPVRAADAAKTTPAKFKLGTISYNIGATWDLATLLRACLLTEPHAFRLDRGLCRRTQH